MKILHALLAFMLVISSASISMAQNNDVASDTFKVYGNCGMCKARIEKAAKSAGALNADWNVETKILTVAYNTSNASVTAIEKNIAAVGHDTPNFSAPDAVYNKLMGCCKYDRKSATDAAVTNASKMNGRSATCCEAKHK